MFGSGWTGGSGGNPFGGWGGGDHKSGWGNVKGDGKWGGIAFGVLGAVGAAFVVRTMMADDSDTKAQAAEQAEAAAESSSLIGSIMDPVVSALATGVELGMLGGIGYLGMKLWQQSGGPRSITVFRLKPMEGIKVNRDRIAEMVKEFRHMYAKFLWNRRVWIKWQIIRKLDGFFEFRVFVPTKDAGTIFKRIAEAYPELIIQEEREFTVPDFYQPDRGEVASMRMNTFPWQKERGLRADLQNRMGSILSMMPYGTIMEILFSPSSLARIEERAKKVVKQLEEKQKRGKDKTDLINLIRQRYAGNRTAFDVHIDFWSLSSIGSLMGEISGRTESYAKLRGREYSKMLKDYRNPFNWSDAIRPLAVWRSSRLTDLELAPFFMLPEAGHKVWEFIKTETKRPTVTKSEFVGAYGIGYIDSEDPDQHGRVAGLKFDTITNHGLIAGKSGGGKGSVIMMLMKLGILLKFVKQEPNYMGATICDPHTEDIYLILNYLLYLEDQGYKVPWEKVKVVSFGDWGAEHYPVAANVLHMSEDASDTEINKTAASVEEMILSAFDSSSLSQSVSYLKKAVQGLLYTPGDHSLLDIITMFEYSVHGIKLRNDIISSLNQRNDVVRRWWEKTANEIMEKENDMKVNAIDSRLAPLMDEKSMQRFFCRKDNFFKDIPKWIADGYLVLIDFRGALDGMFRLGAAWLARQYFESSQKRGTGGRPHLLLYDETQKFDATEVFFKILTENRKFDCGLVLATQDVDALPDKLKDSIQTNAGFVVSVQQEKGASVMAEILGKPFTPDELKGLEKGKEACIRSFDGKARLMLDYPAYYWKGVQTERKSDEESKAKEAAHEKFMELLARDHQSVKEADEEIAEFVSDYTPLPKKKKNNSNDAMKQVAQAMAQAPTTQEPTTETVEVRKKKR